MVVSVRAQHTVKEAEAIRAALTACGASEIKERA